MSGEDGVGDWIDDALDVAADGCFGPMLLVALVIAMISGRIRT